MGMQKCKPNFLRRIAWVSSQSISQVNSPYLTFLIKVNPTYKPSIKMSQYATTRGMGNLVSIQIERKHIGSSLYQYPFCLFSFNLSFCRKFGTANMFSVKPSGPKAELCICKKYLH